MSRYPFMEYATEFMKGMEGVYSDSTIPGLMRRYRRMSRDFIQLYESGEISTLSPKKFTADDVKAFLIMRKKKDLSFSEIRRDISALSNVCIYCGNNCVKECLLRYPKLKPSSRNNPRLETFTAEEYENITNAYTNAPKDFRHIRAYTMVFISMYCGTRTKEIRYMNVQDVDTTEWIVEINHPKGEDSYGLSRIVPVPVAIQSLISTYLLLRSDFVKKMGIKSDALFPSSENRNGYLSDKTLRSIKKIVEDESGVRFDFRKCRRSFGQNYIDLNLELSSVSVLMGHATTKTTEKFYGRRRNMDAVIRAREVLMDTHHSGEESEKTMLAIKRKVPKTEFIYGKNEFLGLGEYLEGSQSLTVKRVFVER